MSYSSVEKLQFESAANRLTVNAPAKLNLYLMIAGKRPDGYHSIDTLMSKITWYDQVIIEKTANEGIELICKGDYWAPDGDDNLVLKAAKAFTKTANIKPALRLTLIKNIPAGTGLGSASSDAAAAILGLNRFCETGFNSAKIAEIASQFGSDTAFFTSSPLAVCKGRGEILEQVSAEFNFEAIVIIPDLSVSTADVYKNYKHNESLYQAASEKIKPLMANKQISKAASLGINMLAKSCFELNNELNSLSEQLSETLGSQAVLSGSGSAFYAIIDDRNRDNLEQKMRFIQNRLCCKCILVSNNRW